MLHTEVDSFDSFDLSNVFFSQKASEKEDSYSSASEAESYDSLTTVDEDVDEILYPESMGSVREERSYGGIYIHEQDWSETVSEH